MMKKKKLFDKCISLGSFCMTANQIRKNLDQPEAYIFDWWVTHHESIIKMIREDFSNLLKIQNLELRKTSQEYNIELVFDKYYGNFYNHDFPRYDKNNPDLLTYGGGSVRENWEESLPNAIQKNQYLLKRWHSTLALNNNKILFIRIEYDWTPKKALELRNLLLQYYPKIQFHLLVAGLASKPYCLDDTWNLSQVTTFHVPPPENLLCHPLVPQMFGRMPPMDWCSEAWSYVLQVMNSTSSLKSLPLSFNVSDINKIAKKSVM